MQGSDPSHRPDGTLNAMDFRAIRPADLDAGETYRLLVATVQPRPIAFVSTVSANGTPNLAPYSFFMAGGANPASLMFSAVLNRHGEPKDSLRNVLETREFVVNAVTRAMAEGMNRTSVEFSPEVDEWAVGGFSPLPSECVRPARVAESPVQFECRLHEVVAHGEGPAAARYIIGEVLQVHVSERLIVNGVLSPNTFRPISRMGGPDYLDTERLEVFSLPRPAPPEASR